MIMKTNLVVEGSGHGCISCMDWGKP